MVHIAHQFAFLNSSITADMVDLTQFPYLAIKYNVTGVPKTIINGDYSLIGTIPAEPLYLETRKVIG
jgi:hypothetical protein